MSKTNAKDTNYVHPKKVSLRVHLFQAPNYFGDSHIRVIEKTEKMLREHGLDLHCWMSKVPMLMMEPGGSGPRGLYVEEDYPNIKARVDEIMGFTKTSLSYVPVVFCNFTESGHGVTPWKKFGWKTPVCLISARPNDDLVTMLHELGHAAGLDHDHAHDDSRNFMHEGEGRTTMYRGQIEQFAKCYFAG